jgi:hypothetical protein
MSAKIGANFSQNLANWFWVEADQIYIFSALMASGFRSAFLTPEILTSYNVMCAPAPRKGD